MQQHSLVTPIVYVLFFSLSSFQVAPIDVGGIFSGKEQNPFTPKAYLIRYWNKKVQNDAEKPSFMLSKASPLTAVDTAAFTKLAAKNALSTLLPEFCSSANLLCSANLGQSREKHDSDSSFTGYSSKNFTNYGSDRLDGVDSFKNYSLGENEPVDSFRRYSRASVNHKDRFTNYGAEGNQVNQSFTSYATNAVTGAGEFKQYGDSVNQPDLRFNSYSEVANGRAHSFKSYIDHGNDGKESFTSYSKNASGSPNEFTAYGDNVVVSGFSGYGSDSTQANDTFVSYGVLKNNPRSEFRSYGDGGNLAKETFSSYRDSSNVATDSFKSYAKNSTRDKINFVDYGQTSNNGGGDNFTGYGSGSHGLSVGFKIYGKNETFKDYAKQGVNFTSYLVFNSSSGSDKLMAATASGSLIKRWVEPGKFFRESMLKVGVVMPMPDIKDKMPKRSFLPRAISSKLPFASSKISELKKIFRAADNSAMEKMMSDSLQECERAPSPGETKRCVESAEDMIDFATAVLGRNIVVRTTDNVNGSNHDVLIGSVKGINGGNVTKSVSCHQSLFPYLLYYCHSVPKVRVYEADLLDPSSKVKINRGVAICHLDTSAWSPSHAAFVALGSGPGRTEVCHWIFQNDMTWNIAD